MESIQQALTGEQGYLSPEHRKTLTEESGISEEVIRARGYWRTAEDAAELAPLGFAKIQRRAPALVIPVRGIDGNVRFSRMRPDNPRRDPRRRGGIIKYEQPANVETALDIPSPIREVLGGVSNPLWIVEGEKKADSLVSRGEVAIAVLGVWNWKKDGWMLPDWENIPLIGREVLIAFDSDAVSKYEVRQAEEAFAKALEGRMGYGDAASQNGAMNKAWRKCDRAASQDAFYEGDCKVAVWVKNGWAAVAHERSLEGPPFASAPTWGSGWGPTRNDAIYRARQDCEPRAGEPCDIERIERTPVL